jgi:hypothetical protein
MRFGKREGVELVVDYAFGGSPAARAGITTGDRLLAVDGRPTAGLTVAEVAELIRGPIGTSVRLRMLRTGPAGSETLDVAAERTNITFPERLFPARSAGQYGFIDPTGSMFIPPVYDFAGRFSEGMAVVGLGGRKGYIDRTGTSADGIRFDDAYPFLGGFGRVQLGDECWFVDRSGRPAFRPGGSEGPLAGRTWRFSEGRALFMAGQGRACRYGFLDTTGRLVIDAAFLWADDFHGGLAPARSAGTGKLGYIDPAGNWAIEPRFDEAAQFACGRAFVRTGDRTGFINRAGRLVIEGGDRSYGVAFNEGLVVFGRNEKFGYADTAGRIVIEPRYDDAGVFSDGMAWVKVGDKCGYINRRGNMVIQPRFELTGVDNYYDGLALVTHEGKQQYIDKTGRVVWREP